MLIRRRVTAAAVTLTLASALASAAYAQATKMTSEFKDWSVYEHKGAPADICFATSQPKETSPRGVSRSAAYFYVSSWPKDGVKSEVSLKLGFGIKSGTEVLVQIGSGRFTLFPKGDKAFVSDPREELKLLDAMKRGSFMTVTADSEGGTTIKDTYSLIGVTQALGAIDSCS